VGEKVILCVVFSHPSDPQSALSSSYDLMHAYPAGTTSDRSRVIAPKLRPAVAVAAALALLVGLVRNVIAAARLATLHVHAPRHQEVALAREAMAVVVEEEKEEEEEEDTVVLAAVRKHGTWTFCFVAWHLVSKTFLRLFEVTRAEE
jgi:hypothetical protein